MNRLISIVFLLFLLSCSTDRTIVEVSEVENSKLINFQKLNSKSILNITDKNEPGEKLLLCLTFKDKKTGSELIGQKVYLYHTNATGDYQPLVPGDETTARLNGSITSDSSGRAYIETILPGGYGGSEGSGGHIHTTVEGARPEFYNIYFKQYTGFMGRRSVNGSDQFFLADLKMTKENELVSFLTIEVKKP